MNYQSKTFGSNLSRTGLIRTLLLALIPLFLTVPQNSFAQTAASGYSFMDFQKSFPRINEALKRKEDTLKTQFKEKGLAWPAKYMYIRSFKYDSQLEVWVKYEKNEKFKLFKTYRVCALSGSLGPKRMQGDYQVPEGFYYINEFNPRSSFHLSLGLNYPNPSDRILSDTYHPGGDIYIHGSCVTTGCIPILDNQIEELYILAAHAKEQGQDFIPVHIFPIRFNNSRSTEYLGKYLRDYPEYKPMVKEFNTAYTYFEKNREIPIIMVNAKGQYVLDGDPVSLVVTDPNVKKPRDMNRPRSYEINRVAKVVDVMPEFAGGPAEWQRYLDKVTLDLSKYMAPGQTKTYIMIEYLVEENGEVKYAKVIRGGNETMNEELEFRFTEMPALQPATRNNELVCVLLKQNISVERKN